MKRQFSVLHSFGFSFAVLSTLTGITSLLTPALSTGGPAVIVWGWLGVSFMMVLVSLAMAELCSAYPVSGGLYYWSAVLGGRRYGPFFAWITAWFNILGWIAVTASINYACIDASWSIVSLFVSCPESWIPAIKLGLFLVLLINQGVLNTWGHSLLGFLNIANVWWHIIGTIVLIVVLAVANSSKSTSNINPLSMFVDRTGLGNIIPGSSDFYAAAIGLLQAQYTYTGFDAAAHNCDEILNASTAGPMGIILSVGVAAIVGWAYILGLVFAIRDYDAVAFSNGGGGALFLFTESVGVVGGASLMMVVVMAMGFAGLFCVTTTSRILYTFSGDGGLPRSSYWHSLSSHTLVPIRSVWLTVGLSFLITTPSVLSETAFTAVTSIATIGFFISYAIPITLRHTLARARFIPGIFTANRLGPRTSAIVGWISICWIAIISILFILPTRFPVSIDNFNFAPLMVILVGGGSMGSWWLGGVKSWFKGPKSV